MAYSEGDHSDVPRTGREEDAMSGRQFIGEASGFGNRLTAPEVHGVEHLEIDQHGLAGRW
jgi:hypothetical protein